ncbi:Fur family zinc uptake transcriptional regulator [Enterococcus sp. PF1-24]|uniref:Fur family transcriptional regulator n=1 Tax=unclassified Enterococcus TaxID=2608891 RepID=UPI0024743192|nr:MULTISPECIES: Fur family transcriptional regulator [unclassified Enterococcus]MDH6365111.1 Fur family zinc uptake transcriptional regulator [Enterococcus sp. PFB1-1]MDH6402212.1 Fur family zinc uptake transcriptional regulator [Enterococcus sp. PF1-24]
MENQSIIEESLLKLKEQGMKYTKKREALITFFARCNRYISAREVHEYMSDIFPGISYDTIYRNLHDFSDFEILEETELNGEMKFRIHCRCQGHIGHHHHFICTVCGKTREIYMCPMDYFKEQLVGCEIEGHRFEILGRCEECSQIS